MVGIHELAAGVVGLRMFLKIVDPWFGWWAKGTKARTPNCSDLYVEKLDLRVSWFCWEV